VGEERDLLRWRVLDVVCREAGKEEEEREEIAEAKISILIIIRRN
jgi:hypothetical protein